MAQKPRRSLVAVMFTDVVGYTAMMQQDEELALNARRRRREALERVVLEAGGEVLQLFGDGGLSTFPSSVNAVKAATELQQSFEEEPAVPSHCRGPALPLLVDPRLRRVRIRPPFS